MSIFAERVKAAREKLKLSQAEVGEMACIPASSVSHFESGQREPATETLRRLCKCLGVTSDYLLGLDMREKDIEGRIAFLENEFARFKKNIMKPYAEARVDNSFKS